MTEATYTWLKALSEGLAYVLSYGDDVAQALALKIENAQTLAEMEED